MKNTLILLCLLATSAIPNYTISQTGTTKKAAATVVCPPGPNARIADDVATRRHNGFAGCNAYKHIVAEAHKPQPGIQPKSYKLSNLFSLLTINRPKTTGIKIYFGLLSKENNSDDDCVGNNKDLLIPIFVCTYNDGHTDRRDFGDYYVFNPNSGAFKKVKIESANAWYANYRDVMQKHINDTDTHSLWFDITSLENMRCELSTMPSVTDFNIWWGAYDDDIIFKNRKTAKVKGHLTMVLYVPDATKVFRAKAQGYYDTAVPCPPGENCDDGNELPYPPAPKRKKR